MFNDEESIGGFLHQSLYDKLECPGYLEYDGGQWSVNHLNDSERLSFSQIADLIEEQW